MFDQINTGPVKLNDMESRRGRLTGPFMELVKELARDDRFRRLAPISEAAEKRYEREELIARFFTYSDEYARFGLPGTGKVVSEFVDDYAGRMNHTLRTEGPGGPTEQRLRRSWADMLELVETRFRYGFAKGQNARSTPRVRFEAIAVGTSLALAQNTSPPGAPDVGLWIGEQEFRDLPTSDAANNRSRVIGRIEFVRDKLLQE